MAETEIVKQEMCCEKCWKIFTIKVKFFKDSNKVVGGKMPSVCPECKDKYNVECQRKIRKKRKLEDKL